MKILHALYKIRTSPHHVDVFAISNTVGIRLNRVQNVLQPLIDEGLIKQDSRDSGGPFEPYSTYYTVRAKREEIDQLLQRYSRSPSSENRFEFFQGREFGQGTGMY